MAAYLSDYQPLQSFSFADQAAAGMSSGNFDVEGQNMASGSGEGRVGLDAEGVEEVRRIMYVGLALFFQPALSRLIMTSPRSLGLSTVHLAGLSIDVISTRLV
jgi:hypothetical protein